MATWTAIAETRRDLITSILLANIQEFTIRHYVAPLYSVGEFDARGVHGERVSFHGGTTYGPVRDSAAAAFRNAYPFDLEHNFNAKGVLDEIRREITRMNNLRRIRAHALEGEVIMAYDSFFVGHGAAVTDAPEEFLQTLSQLGLR